MGLLQVKSRLKELETIRVQLSSRDLVTNHFDVKEGDEITQYFIDCGRTERIKELIIFQL